MSNQTNDRLVEEAKDLLDELSGTGLEIIMEQNIAKGDYEALFENMKDARSLLFDQNFRPGEIF